MKLKRKKAKLGNIEKTITLPESVNAPVKKGQKVGQVEYFIDGKSLGICDIVSTENIKAQNPWGMIKKITSHYFYNRWKEALNEPLNFAS